MAMAAELAQLRGWLPLSTKVPERLCRASYRICEALWPAGYPRFGGTPVAWVFINYRGADSQLAAALVDRELTARFGSDRVFLDSRSIPAGVDFQTELLGRLQSIDRGRKLANLLLVLSILAVPALMTPAVPSLSYPRS
jgi:hypothetical protein